MKKLLIALFVCISIFGFVWGDGLAKQKPKKPDAVVFRATLQSSRLTSTWPMEIRIDEISTREEMLALQQAYAAGGDSAVRKVLEKLHKGYCDLGSMDVRMQVMVVLMKSDGARRRFDILAQGPSQSYFAQFFSQPPEYPYVFIQIEVDENGFGKGSIAPKTQFAFNPQGEMTLRNRSTGDAHLTMVQAVK